jgi:hypothetical protein
VWGLLSLSLTQHRAHLTQVIVLGVYLAGAGVCVYGATKVQLGLKLTDAVPSGTYLHDFAVQSEANFQAAAITLAYDTNKVDAAAQVRGSTSSRFRILT